MNARDKLILEEYRRQKSDFERLGTLVHTILNDTVKELGIMPLVIEHRVKGEESLKGKLLRSDGWYKTFDELMDVLGERVVLYFSDEVDLVSKKVEELFDTIDEFSSNKADLLNDSTFGYLSVHYICTLPRGKGYPEELCGKKFEIQIRTGLQHIWAAIDHDIAYKSKYGVPRNIRRGFARLAGLLELADDEFMRVRDCMSDYQTDIRAKIENNEAEEVPINMISLDEFMQYNREMKLFLEALAKIEGSEIRAISAEPYIAQLAFFGIETLGGVQDLLLHDGPLAYRMAQKALTGSELDIISSNVALRFLCRAHMLDQNTPAEKMTEFFLLSFGDRARAEAQTQRLLALREKWQAEGALPAQEA